MPESMRCVQIDAWGSEPSVAETNRPTAGATDVVVEVAAIGVGLTVQNVIDGNMKHNPDFLPRIPGHEFVGSVAETGDGVTHVDEGDFVGAYFHLVCGHCPMCNAGRDTLCENHGGWVSVDIDGGFAEYARLPAENAIKLPADLDPVEATVVPDAVATPYHVANQRANVDPGDDVMVLGAGGGVGIHMVQMARYFGADVTAVDIVDEKLTRCRELGADRTVNPRQSTETIADSDVQYDAIIDFTGDTSLLADAINVLAPRGRLVNLTTFPGNMMQLSPRTEVIRELEVVGSKYCAKHEFQMAGDLVADGSIDSVVTEVGSLDDAPELLNHITANKVVGRAAVEL